MFVISAKRTKENPTGRFYCGSCEWTKFYFNGLSSAKRYASIKEAQAQLSKFLEEPGSKKIDDFTIEYGWDTLSIIAENSIPYHKSWENAYPIDIDHLHEPGRTVRIVPRCGWSKKLQVSGDFLRDQILAGWDHSNDGFSRWEYDDER
jgi:hypothetical protein